MNYQRIYDRIVERAKTRSVPPTYTELHHIEPKCMGGSDRKENLVRLTAKEHYVAHHLLYLIHKTAKMAHAWFCMTRVGKGQQRKTTAQQYAKARSEHVHQLKKAMRGANNHFYGRSHSLETRKKISDANIGKTVDQATIDNWVIKVAKKKKTPEHRKKIARKGFAVLKNVLTGEVIRIPKQDVVNYDNALWKNPFAISPKRKKCDYCAMESTIPSITRWHDENCKHNPNRNTSGL